MPTVELHETQLFYTMSGTGLPGDAWWDVLRPYLLTGLGHRE